VSAHPATGGPAASAATTPARAPRREPVLRRLGEYAGFGPAIILFGGFLAVPLVLIALYSFWKVVDYQVVHQWTTDNYSYLFTTAAYRSVAWATVWMTVVATGITIAMAFPFAYWLVRYVPAKWQKPALLLVIVPFWTSYLLRVYAWTTILGEKGVLNRALEGLGIIHQPLSFLLYDRPSVIIVLVYLYFPFAVLTLYASLERFDWTQLKAAMDLGASPMGALRRIMVPQVRPGITTAVIFVLIPILGEYLTPQLVGGAHGVMVGNTIVNFFQNAQYTRGAAAALLVATGIVALLVIFRKNLRIEDAHGAR
jgi:ABC-type spermidine/putrescine transport system permease subunit I